MRGTEKKLEKWTISVAEKADILYTVFVRKKRGGVFFAKEVFNPGAEGAGTYV